MRKIENYKNIEVYGLIIKQYETQISEGKR